MTTYERVTFRPEGQRARSVYLQNPVVAGSIDGLLGEVLVGVEVDREGTEVAPKGVDERRHYISLALVVRRVRYVMSNTYGVLEPAVWESCDV